jgi:hypothetical protein
MPKEKRKSHRVGLAIRVTESSILMRADLQLNLFHCTRARREQNLTKWCRGTRTLLSKKQLQLQFLLRHVHLYELHSEVNRWEGTHQNSRESKKQSSLRQKTVRRRQQMRPPTRTVLCIVGTRHEKLWAQSPWPVQRSPPLVLGKIRSWQAASILWATYPTSVLTTTPSSLRIW